MIKKFYEMEIDIEYSCLTCSSLIRMFLKGVDVGRFAELYSSVDEG